MHICYLTSEYPGNDINHGGIGSIIKFLAESLVKKNIKVTVIGIYNFRDYVFEKINYVDIHRIPVSTIKIGKSLEHRKKILNKINEIDSKNKIDIIEGSELSFAFFPKKTSYKKIIRLHGGHHFFALELNKKTNFWKSYQEKKSFKKADYFIAVSNYVGKKTQKYLNKKFNYTVIHNTIDEKKFYESNKIKMIPKSLLFIGTICEKKGIKDLIFSMPSIVKKHPEVKLRIIGRDSISINGRSYLEYIESIITDLNINQNIDIVGPVKHEIIPLYIEKTQICIYPSHMEALPIAWLEGLFMNKAVIATNIGPGKEVIENRKTGILVEPKSPKDLSSKINYLLENEDFSLKIAKNARISMQERFSSTKIIEENIIFYNSIL